MTNCQEHNLPVTNDHSFSCVQCFYFVLSVQIKHQDYHHFCNSFHKTNLTNIQQYTTDRNSILMLSRVMKPMQNEMRRNTAIINVTSSGEEVLFCEI